MTYKTPPSRQVIETGPSIGTYQDSEIPSWIKSGDGVVSKYIGIFGPEDDLRMLKPNQSVIYPGLIYETNRGVTND